MSVFVRTLPPVGTDQSCANCAHRSYGDGRLVSQCALKIQDYQLKAFKENHDCIPPRPRARDFGAKCKRWQPMSMFKNTPLGAEIEAVIAGGATLSGGAHG